MLVYYCSFFEIKQLDYKKAELPLNFYHYFLSGACSWGGSVFLNRLCLR